MLAAIDIPRDGTPSEIIGGDMNPETSVYHNHALSKTHVIIITMYNAGDFLSFFFSPVMCFS